MPSSHQPFSKRQGYIGQLKEITIREDAPKDLRFVLLETIRALARKYQGEYPETGIRDVVAKTLKKWLDPTIWHYQGAWEQIEPAVYGCEWFRVYDLMESIYTYFKKTAPKAAEEFAEQINDSLVEQGIGWKLFKGQIVTRGDEAFEHTIQVAAEELAARPTTQARIQEAIRDLSRRPKPDLPGAISHAFAALESVVGDIKYSSEEARQNKRHTFGAFLVRHPNLFRSEDVKKGFEFLWNYANNEGSRHAKEGIEPERDEAELVVSLAAALVTYINRKHPK